MEAILYVVAAVLLLAGTVWLTVKSRANNTKMLARVPVDQPAFATVPPKPAITQRSGSGWFPVKATAAPKTVSVDAATYLWSARQLSESPHTKVITDKTVKSTADAVEVISRTINSLPPAHREDVIGRRIELEHARRMRSTAASLTTWQTEKPSAQALEAIAQVAYLNVEADRFINRSLTISGTRVPVSTILLPVVEDSKTPSKTKGLDPIGEVIDSILTPLSESALRGIDKLFQLFSGTSVSEWAQGNNLVKKPKTVSTVEDRRDFHNELNELGRWVTDESVEELAFTSYNAISRKETELDRLRDETNDPKHLRRLKFLPRVGDEIVARTVQIAQNDIAYDHTMHEQMLWILQSTLAAPAWYRGALWLCLKPAASPRSTGHQLGKTVSPDSSQAFQRAEPIARAIRNAAAKRQQKKPSGSVGSSTPIFWW